MSMMSPTTRAQAIQAEKAANKATIQHICENIFDEIKEGPIWNALLQAKVQEPFMLMSLTSAEVSQLVTSVDDEGAILSEPIQLSLSECWLIKDLLGYHEDVCRKNSKNRLSGAEWLTMMTCEDFTLFREGSQVPYPIPSSNINPVVITSAPTVNSDMTNFKSLLKGTMNNISNYLNHIFIFSGISKLNP
jgi:hypothetical protein